MEDLYRQKTDLIIRRRDLAQQGPLMAFLVEDIDAKLKVIEAQIRTVAVVVVKPVESITLTAAPSRYQGLNDQQRNRFRRDEEDTLQELQMRKKHCEETVNRLRNDKQPFRVAELLDRARSKLENTLKEIKRVEQKIQDINNHVYDEEFIAQIEENKRAQLKKERIKAAAKASAVRAPARIHVAPREIFVSRREMDREYKYYMSGWDKFPEHMKEKLKKMPSNCGFIWHNSFFYGAQKERHPVQNCTLTERVSLPGGGFEIHEHVYTPTEHIIYRLNGARRKEQIFREMKLRIPTGL